MEKSSRLNQRCIRRGGRRRKDFLPRLFALMARGHASRSLSRLTLMSPVGGRGARWDFSEASGEVDREAEEETLSMPDDDGGGEMAAGAMVRQQSNFLG